MNQPIWAPWRVRYVTGKRSKACVFCSPVSRRAIEHSRHSISVLNIYPYNPGHVMVIPKRHVASLSQLSEDELLDMMQMVRRTQELLGYVVKPQGFNIGMNLGKFAGAGIWQHLHMHIVPRWLGDTNCMPVIANTKVISASLEGLRNALLKAAKKHPMSRTQKSGKRATRGRRK